MNPVYVFYNKQRNNCFADFTTKYPGEKIFLLALFYHLLTIYFGVGDYCLSNSPTSCLFSSQSSSLYWLRSANTDKQLLLTVAQHQGPNQLLHSSYPTLQAIELIPKVDILTNCPQLGYHHNTKT